MGKSGRFLREGVLRPPFEFPGVPLILLDFWAALTLFAPLSRARDAMTVTAAGSFADRQPCPRNMQI
jgi:hypothetical protein